MLKMYFDDIKKYGNEPSNVGVDGILIKYSEKYLEYETLYGKTYDLLEKIQNPAETVPSSTETEKGGGNHFWNGRRYLKGSKQIVALLATEYKGMDQDIYREVAKLEELSMSIPSILPSSRVTIINLKS